MGSKLTPKNIMFIILALVLLYAGYSYAQFQATVKRGVELASRAVAFERKKPEASTRILVAGDSTAVGTGVIDPKTSTAGRFGEEYPEAEIVNLGKNGKRISELLQEIKEQKETLGRFEIVVIQIGGNDITHFTPIKEVEQDIVELLTIARTMSRKVIVLHTGDLGRSPIFPWPVNWIITYQTKLVRDVYLKATALTDTHYVDLYSLKTDDEFHTDTNRFYAVDSFHLSGDGYGVWYREIKKVLQKIN